MGGRRRHPHRPPRRRGLRRLAVIFQEHPHRGTAQSPRCGPRPWNRLANSFMTESLPQFCLGEEGAIRHVVNGLGHPSLARSKLRSGFFTTNDASISEGLSKVVTRMLDFEL